MIAEYSLFVELCYRTRTNSLTAEDTITLLKHPDWIDQIQAWNTRYLFQLAIQN